MSQYESSVELYMSQPVHAVESSSPLADAYKKLRAHRISSLAVVDSGKPVGVLSRTDLLRVGRLESGRSPKSALLSLPDKRVRDAMTHAIVTVRPDVSIKQAARKMVDDRLHRVFVVDKGRLVGVLSTKDVMLAVSEAKDARPISELMSSPVLTARASEPVALAVERLEQAHVSGVVITDSDWPVGVFTQVESLTASNVPRDTPVEEVMSPAMLCMAVETPTFRAAAQAAATRARRVIATEGREMKGILTGIDFTRAVV